MNLEGTFSVMQGLNLRLLRKPQPRLNPKILASRSTILRDSFVFPIRNIVEIENSSEFFALSFSENNERFDLLVWPKERLKILLYIVIFINHLVVWSVYTHLFALRL